MKDGRRTQFRRIIGKPTHLKPKIGMKEVQGQIVPVKVYPAQYAEGSSSSRYRTKNATGDSLARSQLTSKLRWGAGTGDKSHNTTTEQKR
jgi:hypothetical protein